MSHLEKELVGIDKVQGGLGPDESEDPFLVRIPERRVVHLHREDQGLGLEELSERERGSGLHHHQGAVDGGRVAGLRHGPITSTTVSISRSEKVDMFLVFVYHGIRSSKFVPCPMVT